MKALPPRDVTWRGRKVPPAFVHFSMGFHQDAFVLHSSLEDVVICAIGFVPRAERGEFAAYVRKLLSGKYDDSELKGLWNRLPTDISAKRGVRQILEMALEKIDRLK